MVVLKVVLEGNKEGRLRGDGPNCEIEVWVGDHHVSLSVVEWQDDHVN